jgi:tripartite-type tricarboxylate transporter receptor subunit TctC
MTPDHHTGVVLVEPFGRGGGPDLVGRALAGRLAEVWGEPVVVDNRPGAGATAGPAAVAAAPPDGRTLLLNTSAHAYGAALLHDLPYDPVADFVPVAPLTSQSYVLVARADRGIRALDDLRQQPNLSFASSGVGTGTHLGVEELNAVLGISAVHILPGPTDAGADTSIRVAAGAADYALGPISMAAPLLCAGTLIALGVSGSRRSRLLPDVPTLAEAGADGFDFPVWYGIWAPAATPEAVLRRLAAGVLAALDAPDFGAWMTKHDADPMNMTQPEFALFVTHETDRARRIAKTPGVTDSRP